MDAPPIGSSLSSFASVLFQLPSVASVPLFVPRLLCQTLLLFAFWVHCLCTLLLTFSWTPLLRVGLGVSLLPSSNYFKSECFYIFLAATKPEINIMLTRLVVVILLQKIIWLVNRRHGGAPDQLSDAGKVYEE